MAIRPHAALGGLLRKPRARHLLPGCFCGGVLTRNSPEHNAFPNVACADVKAMKKRAEFPRAIKPGYGIAMNVEDLCASVPPGASLGIQNARE
jgi:hypothetical protein